CSGISGTSPKSKPCSFCQSLYALQSDTMVSARLPKALACERNRLTLAVLSSSSPRDMTDLGIDLPPCPLCQCATPTRCSARRGYRGAPRSGKRSYLVGSQFQERASDGKDRRAAGYRCRREREDNGRGEGG